VNDLTVPQLERLGQAQRKAQRVNLGLTCLIRGEWQMVMAITHLNQRRGWSHE
jgi:hypothetical protein